MICKKGLIFIFFLSWLANPAYTQQSRESFGKNRLQYRPFDWQYLSGENFDTYYYGNRKEMAQQALEYLDREFDRITDIIGYSPYFKTKVFIYNSLVDLRQSNVGLNHKAFNVGGETEFIKPYIEVANLGTVEEFKGELLTQISDLLVKEMMFGGNLKDIFQNALLLNLPDWFVNGASLYVSKGWTIEMDDYIRNYITLRKATKLNRLSGKEAGLVGQSVWNFIAEKYGKTMVSNILNYTRVTRNVERSVMITLGKNFRQLINEWRNFYGEMAISVDKSYIQPEDSSRFTNLKDKHTLFTTVKISPDGRYVAYAKNDRGRYFVKVRSIDSGRERTIISGGSKVINQRVEYNMPLISWADPTTLGVIGVKKGLSVFWLYDLSTRSKLPRPMDRFSNIRSIRFSSNGRLAVLSADFEGQNDLFLVSTRRDRVRRLTNDMFDDLDPNFIPGTNKIIFSSNRVTDTLRNHEKHPYVDFSNHYNLFIYDLDSTTTMLTRVTNTLSKDFSPIAMDVNSIFYLSDQRGIVNLFKYQRNTKIYTQLTHYANSIQEFDLNFSNNHLAFVMRKNLKQNIFSIKNINIQEHHFTPATQRIDIQNARIVKQRRIENENENMSVKDLLNARLKRVKEQNDTLPAPQSDSLSQKPVTPYKKGDLIDTDNYVFEDESTPQNLIKEENKGTENIINTENYVLEDEAEDENKPSQTFMTRFMKAREKSRIMGPFPYEPKFSADNLVTSVVINPLWGFGFLLEARMNDMLEDYRFFGGIETSIDARSNNTYAEFQYLPKYYDISVRFDRKKLRWETDPLGLYDSAFIISYALNKLELGISIPITDRLRLSVKPFGAMVRSINQGERYFIDSPPSKKPVNNFYAGLKAELVYDNSIQTGYNTIEGTSAKLTYNHHQGLDNENNSFDQLSLDFRHYQKIYKEITFAMRGYTGSFFGPSPKLYLLGGIDNWAFRKTRYTGQTNQGEPNPLSVNGLNQNLIFAEFAPYLRGYNLATLFGNNTMFLNAELRLPLVRALTSGPITSNFFRNLQLVGFYDIGTSWSGSLLFSSKESGVSYETIKSGPFEINLKNYLNPWLQSYGLGIHTAILGYYVKLNFAWPIEDYQVSDMRISLGFGLDF